MAEYTYTIKNDFVNYNDDWTPTVTGNNTWPTTYWYTYPTTKYLYQIFCPKPRCKGKMWAEIDALVTCPKCTSKIKVVLDEPDYTVPVIKD